MKKYDKEFIDYVSNKFNLEVTYDPVTGYTIIDAEQGTTLSNMFADHYLSSFQKEYLQKQEDASFMITFRIFLFRLSFFCVG